MVHNVYMKSENKTGHWQQMLKKKTILRWNLHESLMINCKLISWPFSKCPPEKPFCQHTLNMGITLQAFMT